MQFNLLLLHLFLFLNVCVGAEDSTREVNGKKMYFFETKATFYKAQSVCAKKNLDMLTIESEEENKLVIDELTKRGHGIDCWIGLYSQLDKEGEQHWHWLATGADPVYKDWCENESSAKGLEFCALTNRGNQPCWQDWSCFTTANVFACQNKQPYKSLDADKKSCTYTYTYVKEKVIEGFGHAREQVTFSKKDEE